MSRFAESTTLVYALIFGRIDGWPLRLHRVSHDVRRIASVYCFMISDIMISGLISVAASVAAPGEALIRTGTAVARR